MSGVQVDHSPAIATHTLDISSWTDADLSALTSSEKKRYYRRKSAIQDYFTTEESLSQIASRYHLPVRMLEKLTKRCEMRHEDGALWGYRALAPGIIVVDHPLPPEPTSPAPEDDPGADTTKTDHEGKADSTDGDRKADGDGEADAINRVPTASLSAAVVCPVGTRFIASDHDENILNDGASDHDQENTTDDGTFTHDGENTLDGGASDHDENTPHDGLSDHDRENILDNGAFDHENIPDDGSFDHGDRNILDDGASTYDENTNDDGASVHDDNAANSIATINDEEARADDNDTHLTASADEREDEHNDISRQASASDNDTNEETNTLDDDAAALTAGAVDEEADTIDIRETFKADEPSVLVPVLEDTPTEDDEDTAPHKAIVLTRQDSVAVDDMPDIMAIEEISTGNRSNGHSGVEAHTPQPDVSQGDSGEFYMPELTSPASRSLVVYERLRLAALPRTSKKHVAIPGIDKRTIIAKRSIRKRWLRSVERTRKRKSYRLIGGVVVAVILLSLLIPVGAGIAAYSAYNSIKNIALDGVNHLLDVKALMPASKSDLTAILTPAKLQRADTDFTQAESDFLQLQQLINRQDIQNLVQQFAPQYSNKLGMAQRLVQVGIDVTRMGNEFIGIGALGANILHGSPLAAGSTKPLITVNDMANIEGAMLHALYYIQDIKTQMSQVSLSQLPISATQQKEIASAMTLLPKAQSYLEQGQGMIGIVSWLLGVGQTRRFLVQTMDRAELRPGGGFTGQYGVLTIQDGRMAPFTLQDVTELDYNGNGAELGRQAPPGYTSWMNFGNFGLRDANLSGDFPTTARLAIQVFQDEGGGPVDGDIAFTPTAIEHVLDVIGPLKIPAYNETITAQNLEDKLHYYQNDPTAIALQREKTGTHNAATRKSFTALVGSTLLSTVRHLSIATLLKIAQNATKDIQARDLEIYFTNPLAEGWLVTHSFSGAMSTFSNTDGFMVVQSNISISKASSDVQTTEQDNIVLDAQGGATHNLTITLDYQGTKPVYSVYTTYADYIRVYAPANAILQGGYGFDTGKALCNPAPVSTGNPGSGKPPTPNPNPGGGTSSLPPCSQYSSTYGSSALYCPNGNYNLGPRGWMEGKGYSNWSIEKLGGPTELTSDLPGRAMWGGLTITPKNCISTITLSWYVPNAVKQVVGQPLYSVLVGKQGGYIPVVQISIDTSQLKGVKPYNFNGNIYGDRLFSLPVVKKGK